MKQPKIKHTKSIYGKCQFCPTKVNNYLTDYQNERNSGLAHLIINPIGGHGAILGSGGGYGHRFRHHCQVKHLPSTTGSKQILLSINMLISCLSNILIYFPHPFSFS
jgi:hypothetical protein